MAKEVRLIATANSGHFYYAAIDSVDSRKIEVFRLQVSPHKVELIPIPQDEHGVVPEILRETLRNRELSGKKMPKIMYINATGSNPTGVIIPLERRKEIYRIACEYNFLILDDDPYHFMHFNEVSDTFILFALLFPKYLLFIFCFYFVDCSFLLLDSLKYLFFFVITRGYRVKMLKVV